ncbi:HIT family protein [Rhizobium sp. BT-226]|uniref:HIT family protein n=1 Tax=Rhizobium sp. BT-226 TaxID=2986922 RepID=UPI0021F78602|nr:HIT domain-containing protein [Rhizobium sp. BT-226]MCW0016062.1 hypothetical protein [Rhizobium sp. BT-226]
MGTDLEKFSWIVERSEALRPNFDVPVLETEDFVVLPSLGSLVAGWVLIIPRRAMPNLSMLSPREQRELTALEERLTQALTPFGGKLYAFEHGGPYGSVVNCGVDQAHLHLVPLQFDLFAEALSSKEIEWQTLPRFSSIVPEPQSDEYLSVASLYDGRVAFGRPIMPQSQWFRKLIAQTLNVGTWDYKSFPEIPVIHQTAHVLSGAANDR